MKRSFTPEIIETKENLLTALRNGDIKSSKYNLLNEEEKLFVELVVFSGYSSEQAMRQIHGEKYFRGMGNRMCARPNISDALEELSYTKNKKYMAELTESRDMAIRKAVYIMNNSEDEAVQLAAAKIILDKAEKATTEKEAANVVNAIQFNITAAPATIDISNPQVDLDTPIKFEEVSNEGIDVKEAVFEEVTPVNNTSGLDFTLNYGSVNNYK